MPSYKIRNEPVINATSSVDPDSPLQASHSIQGHEQTYFTVNEWSLINTLAWPLALQDQGSIQLEHTNIQLHNPSPRVEQHHASAQSCAEYLDYCDRSVTDLLRQAASMENNPATRPYLLIFIMHPKITGHYNELHLHCAISPLLREAFYQQGNNAEQFIDKLSYIVRSYCHSEKMFPVPVVNYYDLAGALLQSRASTRAPRKLFSEKSTKMVTAAKAMSNEFLLLFIMRPETKHHHNVKPKVEALKSG